MGVFFYLIYHVLVLFENSSVLFGVVVIFHLFISAFMFFISTSILISEMLSLRFEIYP